MFSFFNTQRYPRWATIEKQVGETPLIAAERLRTKLKLPNNVPIAYAGRLDPMASGKLIILIGDECKEQEKYHSFDKEYQVEILLGVGSDTGDVLGLLSGYAQNTIDLQSIEAILKKYVGEIQLPYPHFSSKTVKGKPLHVWALEKRLHEIDIPIKKSKVYRLKTVNIRTISRDEILRTVRAKIETIPKVTDPNKALGADFRRDDVRASWDSFEKNSYDTYHLLSITCIASSGTYMRTLAEEIAKDLGTCGLAYSIHRTKIGTYFPIIKNVGMWLKKF